MPRPNLHLLDAAISIAKPATSSDAEAVNAPKWHMLFPLGAVKHRPDFPGGKAVFDRKFCETMVANFHAMAAAYKGQDGDAFALQANYLHPDEGAPIDSHIASGWIEDVKFEPGEGGGLYGLIRWTEKARSHIRQDEFRYLSPEFAFNAPNTSTGKSQGPTLFGVALLNTPFLKELPRVAASETKAEFSAESGARMDKKQICAALGLPEDTADEKVYEKLTALMAPPPPPEEKKDEAPPAALSAEAAVKLSEMQTATKKLADENAELRTKLAAVETEKKNAEVKAFVDGLVKEGRIAPAMHANVTKIALGDLELAKATFSAAKPATGEIGHSESGESKSPEDARKMLRLAAEDIAKKSGIKMSEATLRAMAANPKLAEAAQAQAKS